MVKLPTKITFDLKKVNVFDFLTSILKGSIKEPVCLLRRIDKEEFVNEAYRDPRVAKFYLESLNTHKTDWGIVHAEIFCNDVHKVAITEKMMFCLNEETYSEIKIKRALYKLNLEECEVLKEHFRKEFADEQA